MSDNSIYYNSVAQAAPIDPTLSAKVVKSAKTLGSEDFMKLLAVQFQSQDPMKPMEDTAFIAQMAQFTSLSQTQTMTSEMVKLNANQELITANSYLGKQVIVDGGKAGEIEGQVTAVQIDSTGPRLVVNNKLYTLSSVLYAEPGLVPAPVTTPAQ